MAYDQGIDFRNTAGFVTDPTNCTSEIGATANYPRATPQGNNVGWEDAIGANTRNRSAAVDARLAGIAFTANGLAVGSGKRYRFDLPSSGWYRITLALGDQAASQGECVGVYDGTTVVSFVTGRPQTTGVAAKFIDACGVLRTSVADWVANEVSFVAFFSTTICRIQLGEGGSNATNTAIAHARVTDAVQPSPSFNVGVNFRAALSFVTDPTNTSPDAMATGFADYPHITAQGLTIGWEQAPTAGHDRSAAVDARLASEHAVAAGTQSNFRIDLPAAGAYRLEAAIGDATTAQTPNAQRVEVFDTTTSLGTIVSGGATAIGEFYDATGVKRTSAADWVANQQPATYTFATTILRLKCGIAAGGSASTTIAHVKVAQLAGLTGTSSLSAVLRLLRRFTATLAGASAITATLRLLRRLTATIAGTSSLSATIRQLSRFSVTLAGTSALSATMKRFKRFTATLAGVGHLTASIIGFRRFTATLAGKGTLTATVTTGGATKIISATLTGTSSLRASLPYRAPSGVTTLKGDAPTVYPYYTISDGIFTLAADSPTQSGTTQVPSGIIVIVADPPQLPAAYQPATGVITLRGDAPTLVTGFKPVSGQLALSSDTVTVYPVQPPPGKLILKADNPQGHPTQAMSGRFLLRGDGPNVYPYQTPSGTILLKADSPTLASYVIVLHSSGVIRLRSDTPIVTPLTPPPPPPPPGTGLAVSGTV